MKLSGSFADSKPAFIMGMPAEHHPGGGRYIKFAKHLQVIFIPPPIRSRFFTSLWGWRLDRLITAMSFRPYYTFGLLLMELKIALHMAFHRRRVYHSIKGDVDLCFIPKVSKLTRNFLVASFHEPPEDLKFWRIGPWLTDNLSAAIILGESQREYFDDLLPHDRIHFVPHGIDTEFFSPRNLKEEPPICIAVGSHLRDAPTLTAAMQLVWATLPHVRLVVIGAGRKHDPNPPPTLEDERVIYLDHIDDEALVSWYHRSSVAILALKDAVANNALLEAMSCGLPSVVSDVGSISQYLGEEAGFTCLQSDARSMAAATIALLTDKRLAEKMGAAARARARLFDYGAVAAQIKAIYDRCAHD